MDTSYHFNYFIDLRIVITTKILHAFLDQKNSF